MILPTLLPALLLALSASAPPIPGARSTPCRNLVSLSTPSLRSTSNYRVTLQLHTEDDHGKETHLCQSDYTLRITHPDGTETSADGFFGNDDAWGRPINFRLAGFSHTGDSALLLVTEGGPYPMHELILYDLQANTWEIADLAGALKSKVGAACLADLRVLGTTPAGDAVVAPPSRPGCDPNSRFAVTVADSNTGSPLAEPAKRLPASATILPLDPGTVAQ